jgi:hypothetical protein
MVLGGVVIATTRIFGDHTVFALEAYEIVFFAFYWIVQTAEIWNEKARHHAEPSSHDLPRLPRERW